jgi:uncharacterized damage-inducible protein DinB
MLTELTLADFDEEMAATRKFLERVPAGQMAWRPHEKSMTLGRLAMHLAEIPAATQRVLEADEFHFGAPATPGAPASAPPVRREATTAAEAVETLDANVQKARETLSKADEATLLRPWTFKAFGNVLYTKPKVAAFRQRVLSHVVHHRAQLGVYFRLLGVPVPPTPYGPSADERF